MTTNDLERIYHALPDELAGQQRLIDKTKQSVVDAVASSLPSDTPGVLAVFERLRYPPTRELIESIEGNYRQYAALVALNAGLLKDNEKEQIFKVLVDFVVERSPERVVEFELRRMYAHDEFSLDPSDDQLRPYLIERLLDSNRSALLREIERDVVDKKDLGDGSAGVAVAAFTKTLTDNEKMAKLRPFDVSDVLIDELRDEHGLPSASFPDLVLTCIREERHVSKTLAALGTPEAQRLLMRFHHRPWGHTEEEQKAEKLMRQTLGEQRGGYWDLSPWAEVADTDVITATDVLAREFLKTRHNTLLVMQALSAHDGNYAPANRAHLASDDYTKPRKTAQAMIHALECDADVRAAFAKFIRLPALDVENDIEVLKASPLLGRGADLMRTDANVVLDNRSGLSSVAD
jgi:hypothetical protein